MQMKRYESILFLNIVIIMFVYIVVLGIGDTVTKTGLAYQQQSVYEYLTLVKNHPNQYVLVLGTYAKDYEIEYAEQIADFLGIKTRYESDVEWGNNLVLVGQPSTNLLLDKYLTKQYSDSEALLTVDRDNLIIVVSNEGQAKKVANVISNFKASKERLSPTTVSLKLHTLILYIGFGLALVIPIILFFVEMKRKKAVSMAKESTDDHKLMVLEKYIEKYRQEGHSEKQIKDWLVDYGYDKELVDKAVMEVDNAGANISS
jgi:hypothetical protein